MMDAVVQFIRNALCCVKDLKLYPDSFLHQSNHTNAVLLDYSGWELPEPIDRTTPLEVVISITQLYATLSTTLSGLSLIVTSVGKLRHIVRLLECRLEMQTTPVSSRQKAANRIVNESLLGEARSAVRGVAVGLFVAPIGIAFFWLFAHSWHVTETMWIGGIVGLIDALTVMEACLIPLLFCMVWDGLDCFSRRKKTRDAIEAVRSGSLTPPSMTVTTFQFMEPEWAPFWEAESSSPLSGDDQAKQIAAEVQAVERALSRWFPSTDDGKDDGVPSKDEKEEKIRTEALANAVQTMQNSLFRLTVKGYREFLFFAMNFIAFYGYLMAILCFYYPDDSAQPTYVQKMKFGYPNELVDWSGNFAGDLMWTIEPIFILGTPFFLKYMQPQADPTTSLASATKKTATTTTDASKEKDE